VYWAVRIFREGFGMCRFRALAFRAGFLVSLLVAGCGLNPQPEPPSADETTSGSAGSAGAIDLGPIDPADPPSVSEPVPEPGADNGQRGGEQYSSDDSHNADFTDPTANGATNDAGPPPAPDDAGARDARPAEPPRQDAGSVTNF
jgi:hypothetical protein